MREILFKGKTFGKDVWVEGGCVQVSEGTFILVERENGMFWSTPVIPETVCQFTGLKDKNGVKIFEGDYNSDYDVVTWCRERNGWSLSAYNLHTKQFIECYCYECSCDTIFEISDVLCDFKVVGNIHNKTE